MKALGHSAFWSIVLVWFPDRTQVGLELTILLPGLGLPSPELTLNRSLRSWCGCLAVRVAHFNHSPQTEHLNFPAKWWYSKPVCSKQNLNPRIFQFQEFQLDYLKCCPRTLFWKPEVERLCVNFNRLDLVFVF